MRGLKVLLFLSFLYRPSFLQNACLEDGDIQLLGGVSDREGRVEVCLNQQWGTVCDQLWSNGDAQVVCRQLSLNPIGATAVSASQFDDSNTSPAIWLNNVQCIGSEPKLTQCLSSDIGLDSCLHRNDAGVICSLDPTCEFGEVRLRGGPSSLSGRVEVCVADAWNSVCSTSWSDADAVVLCRQLGHSTTGIRTVGALDTEDGTGPVWQATVQCTGSESRLVSCPIRQEILIGCGHNQDIGVTCQPSVQVCSEGKLRLSGGSGSLAGRVEVCQHNEWGTVCDRTGAWGVESVTVICRQLRYSTEGAQAINLGSSSSVANRAIWLEDVQCRGSESNLTDCAFSFVISPNCTHDRDVGARCQPLTSCERGALRLIGGRNSSEGRVEVCFEGEWGTVCDDEWRSPDAAVVCTQLGFPSSAAVAVSRAGFGSAGSTVRIFLDNVHCIGNEQRLIDCQHGPVGSHNCGHLEDASVICQGISTTSAHAKGTLRLVGGNSLREGRVEIFQNDQWGTVCGLLWDEPDAQVVCRQLGFSSVGATAFSAAELSAIGVGPIWLSNVQCSGTESRLVDCTNLQGSVDYRCYHSEDAAVRCQEGAVLGPASNVRVAFSSVNCSDVTLSWDTPLDQQHVITGYSITVSRTSEPTVERTFFSSTSQSILSSLTCCSEYSYRISARVTNQSVQVIPFMATFTTRPDFTDPILADVVVQSSRLISLRWTTPISVQEQGVTLYFLSVAPECFTGEMKGEPQNFTVVPNGNLHNIMANHLELFVPYRITLNATICNTSIEVYNEIIYTQRDTLTPPVIESLEHRTATSATISFTIPPSEQHKVEYFQVSYFNSTGPHFDEDLLVQSIQTTNQTVSITNLEPCLRYWVKVSAINCGSNVDSMLQRVDLPETTDFMFVILLEQGETCQGWIEAQFLEDVEGEVSLQLSQCELNVLCMADSVLMCGMNHTGAEYQTTLVSFNNSPVEEQARCLREWIGEVGTIRVGGITLSTSLMSVQPTPTGETRENLTYVWVLVGIIVTGIVLALVLVAMVPLLKKVKKTESPEEHKLKQRKDPSLEVTENKLYRRPSGLTDSGRGNSEVEVNEATSEASSTSISSKKAKEYPLTFDPPEY